MNNPKISITNTLLFGEDSRKHPAIHLLHFTESALISRSAILVKNKDGSIALGSAEKIKEAGFNTKFFDIQKRGWVYFFNTDIRNQNIKIELSLSEAALNKKKVQTSVRIYSTIYKPNDFTKEFSTEGKAKHKASIFDSTFVVIVPATDAIPYVIQVPGIKTANDFLGTKIAELLTSKLYAKNMLFDSRELLVDIKETKSYNNIPILNPLDLYGPLHTKMKSEEIIYNKDGEVIYYNCPESKISMGITKIGTKVTETTYFDGRIVRQLSIRKDIFTARNRIIFSDAKKGDRSILYTNEHDSKYDMQLTCHKMDIVLHFDSGKLSTKSQNPTDTILYDEADDAFIYKKINQKSVFDHNSEQLNVYLYNNNEDFLIEKSIIRGTQCFYYNEIDGMILVSSERNYTSDASSLILSTHTANNIHIYKQYNMYQCLVHYQDDFCKVNFDPVTGEIIKLESHLYTPDSLYIRDRYGVPHKYNRFRCLDSEM